MVVASPSDVGVPDRLAFRGLLRIGLVEPMLEDRGDRAVARRTDVVATVAGGLEPLRAVALLQSQDAEAGAEALLGMRLGLHDRLDQRDRGRADLLGLPHHPGRRPLGVAAVRARNVLD